MNIWVKYLIFYVLGIAIGVVSDKGALIESLNILGPITLTALFASLLVPFAGLSAEEKVQKFALQFAIVPLFGLYTVLLWHSSAIGGLALFVMAAGVHVSYWTTSYHSRQYRLSQFQLVANTIPNLTQLIAVLNANGSSHQADAIIQALLKGERPEFEKFNHVHPKMEKMIELAQKEVP